MQEQEKQESPEAFNKRILRWRQWLTGFGALLIVSYVIYFGVLLGQNPAKDADKWGQFGDFFGGLLNPLVAFAAFYWLTQSVKLQKTELADTRKALEEAAEAQSVQAKNGHVSIKLAAITALVNILQSEISIKRDVIDSLKNPPPVLDTNIRWPQLMINSTRLKKEEGDLEVLLTERNELLQEMKVVLKESRASLMDSSKINL